MEGWIKLHRKILESPHFADETVFKVWVWLLCEASIKDRNILLKVGKGKQVVNLKRSQLIFGRNQSALRVGMDPNVLYRLVNKLHDCGSIIIEPNNQYSIITVCNYNDYQSYNEDDDFEILEFQQPTTTNAQATHKQPTTNAQPATHNKKVKKVKKVEQSILPETSSGLEEKETVLHYKKLVDTWFTFYEAKFKSKPSFQSVEGKNLKILIKRLEMIAQEKNATWSEPTAVFYLNHFLEKAYQDEWLRTNNFLLPVLVQKYDSIKNQKNGEHKTNNSGVGKKMEFDKP